MNFILAIFVSFFVKTTFGDCLNNLVVANSYNITYKTPGVSSASSTYVIILCNPNYVISDTGSNQTTGVCGGDGYWNPAYINQTSCVYNATATTTVATATTTVAQQITCATLTCVNNGTCNEGTIPATCSCTSAYTGYNCGQLVTHSIDLNAIRKMSQKAYYTQKYYVDWSEESISGDQLKIAMSCSIAILGALMTAGSYYLSKCLFPAEAAVAPSF